MEGFEVIEGGIRMPSVQNETKPAPTNNDGQVMNARLKDAIADNFGTILQLAGGIVEIKKMETASKAVLAKLEVDRKRILTEAEAYAKKRQADTTSVVERMNIIRCMMQDFYANNNGTISGDDFCKVITEIVNQMGRVEDGIQ